MDRFLYKGPKTKEISFPLGGIGTGCIGLAGNGRLIDWEIFNRPNKRSSNGFSHFAIKAEARGKVLDARVLNGDLLPPYSGEGSEGGGFGWGARRDFLAGMPHFGDLEFRGEFPIASLSFKDKMFPGRVRMIAFNPFIPLNEKDSGIPAAFFEIEVTNSTAAPITYTICGTLKHPLPANNLNRVRKAGKLTILSLASDGLKDTEPGCGDMALATDAADVNYQEYWFGSSPIWFSDLEVFWRDFTAPGKLRNRRYPPGKSGDRTHASIAAHLRVAPGKSAKARFIISWSFPNCEAYWNRERAAKAGVAPTWRNYYATLFKHSAESAAYALNNWDRLYAETLMFKQALFSSHLPPVALDAVSANISILKSPTVMRLEDGTFYGFEGCGTDFGCCEGSCTHVWNYAQALPFLFPKLERSMREADFNYNQRPDGGMAFRLLLPLGSGRSGFRPCADGEFGGVIKTYRDWKICGDTEWLRSLWPAVKGSIEFAWAETNEDRWDPDRTGVLHGRQHHTLDTELFGPNAWLTGFYLAALRAGAEMAEHLGEHDTAREYRALFEKGKRWVDTQLFNGEYYQQLIDLKDRSIPERFGASDTYWDEEHGEIKCQIGEGCALDQVLAQWHANLYGLGEILDPKHTRQALRSIYKYNFKRPMRDHYNPCRVYCLDDEAGVVICDWPAGKHQPMVPVTYAQETMHGFEYAAAAQMIQAGMVRQGMQVVAAVRDRYDGEKRNPWNEIECGSNYARSMASYSLLNAFSGFKFDMVKGLVGFDPIRPKRGRFRCFWSLDSGWGVFEMRPGTVELKVLKGSLLVKTLGLPFLRGKKITQVLLGGRKVEAVNRAGTLELARPARMKPGISLTVTTSGAPSRSGTTR